MPVSVLVDTSVWVRHFREADSHLQKLLMQDSVLMHSMVHAELACGTPPAPRADTLAALAMLRPSQEASIPETLEFLEKNQLFGKGCGLVDLSLLASTLITPGACLWTADRRLAEMAKQLGVAYAIPTH
ncbi:PIN domain-containing protein [Comamonas sp. A7-5]|uniref:type II toxin-antitoxin system VapC family toxin n=1 Tax=Comamonas sp. A7-5 TaxID=673549 RepID=UPI0031D2D41E